MSNKDLRRFAALAAKLAKLDARTRVTYRSLMDATRIMERMSAIRDGASPAVRKVFAKKYRWQSKAKRPATVRPRGASVITINAHQSRRTSR